MYRIICPHCGNYLDDDGSAAGQIVLCPYCAGSFFLTDDGEVSPAGKPPRAGAPRSTRVAIRALILLALVLALATAAVLVVQQYRGMPGREPEPSDGSSVESLVARLSDESADADARRDAAEALVRSGPEAVIRALDAAVVADVPGAAPKVTEGVVEALAAQGPPVVAPLAAALTSDRANVRQAAAAVLKQMGPFASEATPALAAALADENRFVRWWAAEALGAIGPTIERPGEVAEAAIQALIAALEHPDRYTRRRAAEALRDLGPAAQTAAEPLTQARNDPDPKVGQAAEIALWNVNLEAIADAHTKQAPAPIQRLIARLSDEDRFERVEAARELGRLGPEAAAAVPALLRALGHQDKWLRVAAAQALGSLGPAAEPVGPVAFALRRVMQDEDPDVRNAAAEAHPKVQGRGWSEVFDEAEAPATSP